MKPLSVRQLEVIDRIRRHISIHGQSPSRRELASRLRISVNALTCQLHKLQEKGAIRIEPFTTRGIQLID